VGQSVEAPGKVVESISFCAQACSGCLVLMFLSGRRGGCWCDQGMRDAGDETTSLRLWRLLVKFDAGWDVRKKYFTLAFQME
jgi:hypothetical protein